MLLLTRCYDHHVKLHTSGEGAYLSSNLSSGGSGGHSCGGGQSSGSHWCEERHGRSHSFPYSQVLTPQVK